MIHSDEEDLLIILYNSLCNTSIDINNEETNQIKILKYLEDRDISLNYIVMDDAISNWIRNINMDMNMDITSYNEIPDANILIKPVDLLIHGVQVQVYQNNGTAVYDSFLKETNKKSEGFRSYIIGCNVSPAGISFFKKYNKESCKLQIFMAVRQGMSPNDSLGTIVIGINIE